METTNNAAAVNPAAAPVLEKYQVVQQAVREGGKYYLKGQIILLTAERAKELGLNQVKPVGPPAKPAQPSQPKATAPSQGTATATTETAPLAVTADEAAALKKLADTEAAK